jgi:thioredoxin reductase (NADPH)
MDFSGRGVSYCAICDAPFFRGKTVAVVGAGEEAVEDTITLTDFADKVYAIPGSKGYDPENKVLKELRNHDKIEIIEGVDLESIGGEAVVKQITLKGGGVNRLEVDGVFIIMESIPTTNVTANAGIKTDGGNCILVDKNQATNVEGVFAAGDCVCGGMQVVTAAGEGGMAGLAALRYIKSMKRSS